MIIDYKVSVADLIEQGYLSRLTSKVPRTSINTDDLRTQQGDFIQGEADAFISGLDLREALSEAVGLCANRKSILVFCPGKNTAEIVSGLLREEFDAPATSIHSGLKTEDRDTRITAFKDGKVRFLANVNILTEGFDHPGIDAIVMLRPTLSTGLYVQMVGRGLRTASGKPNCLILDYVGNIHRHGPIDDPTVVEDLTVCETCRTVYARIIDYCPACGEPTPREPAEEREHENDCKPRKEMIFESAHDAEEIISRVRSLTITDARLRLHRSGLSGRESLRADCVGFDEAGVERFSEWISFESPHPWAKRHAAIWWYSHAPDAPMPETTREAIAKARQTKLLHPQSLRVKFGGTFPKILQRNLIRKEAI